MCLGYTVLQTSVHNPIDSLNIEDIYEWKILFRLWFHFGLKPAMFFTVDCDYENIIIYKFVAKYAFVMKSWLLYSIQGAKGL